LVAVEIGFDRREDLLEEFYDDDDACAIDQHWVSTSFQRVIPE
jgi:hypothetical protein